MALTDVFCRVNRARSLELLSPEDILNACKIMESIDLPLKLYQFSSGVMVLQLTSLDTESVAEATAQLVSDWLKIFKRNLALNMSSVMQCEHFVVVAKYLLYIINNNL